MIKRTSIASGVLVGLWNVPIWLWMRFSVSFLLLLPTPEPMSGMAIAFNLFSQANWTAFWAASCMLLSVAVQKG